MLARMERGENSSLESPLIVNQGRSGYEFDGETSQQEAGSISASFVEEAKKQVWLAGLLIAVSLLQYCLQEISIMFVGHLGELALFPWPLPLLQSLASVFCYKWPLDLRFLKENRKYAEYTKKSNDWNRLGGKYLRQLALSFGRDQVLKNKSLVHHMSLHTLGMGSALETLCGQAYGAKQYHMLGIHTQRAMITLLAICIPIAVIWFYTSNILIALGQDHEISTAAGTFNCWMIPSLFAYGLLQCLNRFLQTQNNVLPMLIISAITAFLHIIVCCSLVFKSGLESKGAALAITISNWVNVFLLAMYLKFSQACLKTWTGFSREALNDIISFLRLALPSAIMICFEYWSFDMVILLSGLLPNPKLETSVLSVSLNTCWMVYMISVGLGGAIGTRVSNELGAGNSQGARLALRVMIIIAITEGAAVGITTILVRNVWGKLYSNEAEVIKYVAKMMPLLALSDFLDGFQCVLSGAARGCGWQNLCAFINLGAYYVVGIPSAGAFGFFLAHWRHGIICGLCVQVLALGTVNACTNRDQEAANALQS